MATEAGREDFGMTDKGAVTVIRKTFFDDSGENLLESYEVRHGVRTVVEGVDLKKATAVAKALVS